MSSTRAYLAALRARYPAADPASLIASFLILHELTAVVPLALGFLGLRQLGVGDGVTDWILAEAVQAVPLSGASGAEPREGGAALTGAGAVGWLRGKLRTWVVAGEDQAERVGRRYGVLGYDKETTEERTARKEQHKQGGLRVEKKEPRRVGGDVANFLVAYVAVKVSADDYRLWRPAPTPVSFAPHALTRFPMIHPDVRRPSPHCASSCRPDLRRRWRTCSCRGSGSCATSAPGTSPGGRSPSLAQTLQLLTHLTLHKTDSARQRSSGNANQIRFEADDACTHFDR